MKVTVFIMAMAIFVTTVLFISEASHAGDQGKSLNPAVIKTVPGSGAKNVDPSISEIQVTFNKEMMDKSWSWVQVAPENFPQLTDSPRYLEDRRTCVVKVKLEPGKTYIIWLNTQKFTNFKDKDGHPAEPYLLMFETKE
jgi:hypothetical protein